MKMMKHEKAVAVISGALFLSLSMFGQATASSHPVQATGSAPATSAPVAELTLQERLGLVKRIFIDSFGDDPVSKQVQAMVAASLTDSKRFIVTENRDRADAILKGSGLEKTSQEVHAYSDSTAAGGSGGGFSAGGGYASGGYASRVAAISDSSTNTETIDNAHVSVRLVDKDGDVLWATTQESKGAKYKGASADVADKVTKQLIRDFDKNSKKPDTLTPATTAK